MKATLYRNFLILVYVLCLPLVGFAQRAGDLDRSFNTGIGPAGDAINTHLSTTALQLDGKIILGGNFNLYDGIYKSGLARVNSDGNLDTTFNPVISGTINKCIIQTDGKILIVGYLLILNSTSVSYMARLNTDGNIDTNFNQGTGPNGGVSSVAIQPDGKIVIGGTFTSYNSIPRNHIARINVDGSLDTTFSSGTGLGGTNLFLSINSIILQTDGRIIIGGKFASYNGSNRNHIARLNSNGSIDATFDPGLGVGGEYYNTNVNSVSLQTDGKIIIGGQFTTFNGTPRNCLAKLNTNGSLDNSFNIGTGVTMVIGYSNVKSINLQTDGKIIIGGTFTAYNGIGRNHITRLNSNGSLDSIFNVGNGLFGAGGNLNVNTVTLQTNGKIIIGGRFSSFNGTARNCLARLNTNGSIDTYFNNGAGVVLGGSMGSNTNVYSTTLQPDGKIIIGGRFTSYNVNARHGIVRLNIDGSIDTSFNPGTGTIDVILSTNFQSDGKIIIAGAFSNFNGTTAMNILRLKNNGAVDTTFITGTGTNGYIWSTAIQPDGKIIIVGGFTTFNGTPRNSIARLNQNGSLDSSFNPGTGANGNVNCLAIQPNGQIIIGGDFTSYNSTTRNCIARLNNNGSLDPSFNPSTGVSGPWYRTPYVSSINLLSDGKLIIAGRFTSYNGISRNCIARINNNGTIDATFNPGTGAFTPYFEAGFDGYALIQTIIQQSDGKTIIGGNFSSFDGINRNGIARLNINGRLDTSFNPGSGVQPGQGEYSGNPYLLTISLLPDGNLIIGGDFTNYNGFSAFRIARILGVGCSNLTLPTISGYNSLCIGNSSTLISSALNGNLWSTGDTTRSITVSGPGNYSVRAISGSCSSLVSDIFNVTLNEVESPTISGNNTFCTGGTTTLTSSSAIGNLWSTGDTTRSITVSQAGNYSVRVISGACTSAVSDNFRVTGNQQSSSIITQSICQGNTYLFGGLPITTSGTYNDTLSNLLGCDSVITLTITVNPVSASSISRTICQGSSFEFAGLPITTSGTYNDTLSNVLGCDSVVTLTLIVNPGSASSISRAICIGSIFEFGTQTLTTAGTYIDTIQNFNGCDSVITLALIINPISASTISSTICQGSSYLFGGLSRTTSGTYNDTLSNLLGCDSVITLTLTVNPVSASSISRNICQGSSFEFGGVAITTSGTYNDTLSNGLGCDSVVTLALTVNPVSASSISRTICQGSSFVFAGVPITTSGTYNDTLSNVLGCDSVITLTLTVNPVSSTSFTQSICQGNSYQFGGLLRTLSGIYYDTLTNSSGCDSIVTLNLTVSNPSTPTISGDTAFCQGGFSRLISSSPSGNLWSTGDTTRFINVAQAGSYSVRVISGACTSASSVPFRVTNQGPAPTVVNFDTTSNRCLGARLQLTPFGTFAHYYWNTGERTRSIYTRLSGQYSVQVANLDSCFGLPSPPIFIAFDTNWCSVEIFRVGIDSITANVWADYYVWYLDGIELLSSNTLKTIPIQGDGVYTFRAVTTGRTSPLSNPIVITSSKKSLATTVFEIYPNPASDKVTIRTTGTGTIEIVNNLGQVLITQPAIGTNEINISKLAMGVYTVKFNGISQKLVVR